MFAVIIYNEYGLECQRLGYIFTTMKAGFDPLKGLSAAYSMETDTLFIQFMDSNMLRIIPRLKTKSFDGTHLTLSEMGTGGMVGVTLILNFELTPNYSRSLDLTNGLRQHPFIP